MAKTADLVKDSLQELTNKLKEIKSGDEDDLGKLAEMFDDVAMTADRVAVRLSNADRALSEEEQQVPEEQEEQQEQEEQDKPENEDDDEKEEETENKKK